MRNSMVAGMALVLSLAPTGTLAADEEDQGPPAVGSFAPTGSLAHARADHSATLLPDGRVLIRSGANDSLAAEVWDPATGEFVLADPDLEAPVPGPTLGSEPEVERLGHTATLLPDGRLLVVGGRRGGMDPAPTALAEIWDPVSDTLVPAGSLIEPRDGHTATFLRDGRVLITGGNVDQEATATAELWSSATKPARCYGKQPTLFALPGVELVGTPKADVIAGSVGPDIISGGGGHDRICAGDGADQVDGGAGNDRIDGGADADELSGGSGRDTLEGATGHDTLIGGKGSDRCVGGKGNDWQDGCDQRRTRGTIRLTRNTILKGPHKGRFEIGRNGITLDCAGHVVTGPGRRAGLPGVWLVGRKNVKVRNCDLREFNDAFRVERSHRNSFTNNRISRVRQGFTLQRSDRNKIIGNLVDDADDAHGYGIFDGSDRNRVSDNVATHVSVFGFNTNTSKNNVFTNNTAIDNFGPGFTAGNGAVGNTFSGNSAIENLGFGFQDETRGDNGDVGTANHYVDNTCSGNRQGGSTPAILCD